MDCRKFKTIAMTCRACDRTSEQAAWLNRHTHRCEPCRKLLAQCEAMERLLHAASEDVCPSDFTRSVMGRVKQVDLPPQVSWYERAFGLLKPPAPLFSVRQALAVAALVLMVASVGMFLGHERVAGPASAPATVAMANGPGGHVVQMDSEYVDELVARHKGAAAMQPLSDGDGMRLVSY